MRGRATARGPTGARRAGARRRRRDRVDGIDSERLGRDAPAVRLAPRHVLHPRAPRRCSRRRAPLYGLTQRQGDRARGGVGPHPPLRTCSRRLAFSGFFTAITYWRFGNWKPPVPAQEEGDFAFPGRRRFRRRRSRTQASRTSRASRGSRSRLVAGSLLAGIAAYVVSERRAQPRQALGRGPRRAARASSSTRRSTTCEPRPTHAARSSPRTPASSACSPRTALHAARPETSDEYLPRILDDLALDARAVERLTALFTRAKFSHHDVDGAMKEEAIDALEQVRDELRLAAGTTAARTRRGACRSDAREKRRPSVPRARWSSPRIALLGIALVAPGRLELAGRVYALVLCAAVIVVLLLALRRAYPDETVLRRAGEGSPRRVPPPSLGRIEHETALAIAGSFDLHYHLRSPPARSRSRTAELAPERLARRRRRRRRARSSARTPGSSSARIGPHPRTGSRRESRHASSHASSTRSRACDGARTGPGALLRGARRGRARRSSASARRSSSSGSASSRTGTSSSRTTPASRRRSPRARSRRF